MSIFYKQLLLNYTCIPKIEDILQGDSQGYETTWSLYLPCWSFLQCGSNKVWKYLLWLDWWPRDPCFLLLYGTDNSSIKAEVEICRHCNGFISAFHSFLPIITKAPFKLTTLINPNPLINLKNCNIIFIIVEGLIVMFRPESLRIKLQRIKHHGGFHWLW